MNGALVSAVIQRALSDPDLGDPDGRVLMRVVTDLAAGRDLPTHEEWARQLGKSESTLRRSLRRLHDAGLIVWVHYGRAGAEYFPGPKLAQWASASAADHGAPAKEAETRSQVNGFEEGMRSVTGFFPSNGAPDDGITADLTGFPRARVSTPSTTPTIRSTPPAASDSADDDQAATAAELELTTRAARLAGVLKRDYRIDIPRGLRDEIVGRLRRGQDWDEFIAAARETASSQPDNRPRHFWRVLDNWFEERPPKVAHLADYQRETAG